MPKVTMIPATVNPLTHLPKASVQKRRVAGYARVSTDSDEQFTSYEAQVDYYTRYIQSKPEWDFVRVYTDEGISGTNTKRREGFKEMIADALAGKIDLIVTKSVSRFARNTVDSLVTIRKLKEKGVECYFEKEGIYTFDSKGELLITIMSSLVQEESRSISENITWGQRKSFADGKIHLAYKHFLGYKKGEDGRPAIVEEEAVVVRLIYRLFLDGKTQAGICRYLEDLEIPSPSGKAKWSKTTVTSILTNEKYKGDALLQKSFTVDFLQKKTKPNEGEVPQYYVEGSHPAIIEPDEWDHVQAEFARRKELGNAYSGKSVLSAKLVCEDCGGFFGSKVWHSTDRYRRTVWQCNNKFKGGERCLTPTVDTETVQQLFIKAYNQMMENRKQIIEDCELMRKTLTDFKTLDADIERQFVKTQIVAELVKAAVKDNAVTAQSQEAYLEKYGALTQRYETAVAELDRLQNLRSIRSQKDKAMALYIRTLKKQPTVLSEWNDTLWTVMVENLQQHSRAETGCLCSGAFQPLYLLTPHRIHTFCSFPQECPPDFFLTWVQMQYINSYSHVLLPADCHIHPTQRLSHENSCDSLMIILPVLR